LAGAPEELAVPDEVTLLFLIIFTGLAVLLLSSPGRLEFLLMSSLRRFRFQSFAL